MFPIFCKTVLIFCVSFGMILCSNVVRPVKIKGRAFYKHYYSTVISWTSTIMTAYCPFFTISHHYHHYFYHYLLFNLQKIHSIYTLSNYCPSDNLTRSSFSKAWEKRIKFSCLSLKSIYHFLINTLRCNFNWLSKLHNINV